MRILMVFSRVRPERYILLLMDVVGMHQGRSLQNLQLIFLWNSFLIVRNQWRQSVMQSVDVIYT